MERKNLSQYRIEFCIFSTTGLKFNSLRLLPLLSVNPNRTISSTKLNPKFLIFSGISPSRLPFLITHVFSTLQLRPLSILKFCSICFRRFSESKVSTVKLLASSAKDSFLHVSRLASLPKISRATISGRFRILCLLSRVRIQRRP